MDFIRKLDVVDTLKGQQFTIFFFKKIKIEIRKPIIWYKLYLVILTFVIFL